MTPARKNKEQGEIFLCVLWILNIEFQELQLVLNYINITKIVRDPS